MGAVAARPPAPAMDRAPPRRRAQLLAATLSTRQGMQGRLGHLVQPRPLVVGHKLPGRRPQLHHIHRLLDRPARKHEQRGEAGPGQRRGERRASGPGQGQALFGRQQRARQEGGEGDCRRLEALPAQKVQREVQDLRLTCWSVCGGAARRGLQLAGRPVGQAAWNSARPRSATASKAAAAWPHLAADAAEAHEEAGAVVEADDAGARPRVLHGWAMKRGGRR